MSNTVRQSQAPMPYTRTRRMDNTSVLTSGKAGVVIPVAVAPLLRGDSASGRCQISMELAEMPKPLENAVVARCQMWFVPRPSLPQFSGLDEFTHSFHEKTITALGQPDRDPPSLYQLIGAGASDDVNNSELFSSLGISLASSTALNTDYIDAYTHIMNFRRASYSSKAERYEYYAENTSATDLKPGFWPRNRMHNVVPDYERALVVGSLDLDVQAGQLPVSGLGFSSNSFPPVESGDFHQTPGVDVPTPEFIKKPEDGSSAWAAIGGQGSWTPAIYAEMTGQTVPTTLADIDKARTTKAFAQAMAAMAGNNFSGFNNDDVIVSELMQGFVVPEELFHRPWLIANKTVVFGMQQRFATDSNNLDESVSIGRASVALSANVPRAEYGGILMTTVEVMPERLYERQADEYVYVQNVDNLPNALRDLQRTEPVDIVLNRRVDTAHSDPAATFGYEPLNSKWQREFTRLGGEFRQLQPGDPNTVARTAIWQPDVVDPQFTVDHYECPYPFPQDVFSVPNNDIVNISVVQQLTISGHTQFGDDLVEDNGEFLNVSEEKVDV